MKRAGVTAQDCSAALLRREFQTRPRADARAYSDTGASATHVGEILEIAPRGRRVTWIEHEFYRPAKGLIVESLGERLPEHALIEAQNRRGVSDEEQSQRE